MAQLIMCFHSLDGIDFDISHVEVLKEPFFSRKFLRLIGILSTFRFVLKCFIYILYTCPCQNLKTLIDLRTSSHN